MSCTSRAPSKYARRAFSLVEVVTSLALMTVLMLGLSGAVMISVHALPTDEDTGLCDQQVIDVLNQMRSDFGTSTCIKYRSRSGSDWVMTLTSKANASLGSPSQVTYTYTASSKDLEREVDALGSTKLLKETSIFVINFEELDGDAVSAHVLMAEADTIQGFNEMHVLLPDRPEFK
jgi:Prokaryotic N-terminal methylation motif